MIGGTVKIYISLFILCICSNTLNIAFVRPCCLHGATGLITVLAQQKQTTIAALDSIINIKPAELVNTGYISPKRTNITGAVSVVNESRIKDLASVFIDALLQGQAAGVRVVNISSAPGSRCIG